MKLWLDDLRPAPEGWIQAKTRDEAIAILATGEVTEASLDYDINWDIGGDARDWELTRTGYSVIVWMERNKIVPGVIKVHSGNKLGAAVMRDAIKNLQGGAH